MAASSKPGDNHASLMENIEKVVGDDGRTTYKIRLHDIDLMFPFYPYKSQVIVMEMILNACNRAEHCLIESPTGSGKTLALLVGALMWQKSYKDKLAAEKDDWKEPYLPMEHSVATTADPTEVRPSYSRSEDVSGASCSGLKGTSSYNVTKAEDGSEIIALDDEDSDECFSDDDIFKSPKGKRGMSKKTPKCNNQKKKSKTERHNVNDSHFRSSPSIMCDNGDGFELTSTEIEEFDSPFKSACENIPRSVTPPVTLLDGLVEEFNSPFKPTREEIPRSVTPPVTPLVGVIKESDSPFKAASENLPRSVTPPVTSLPKELETTIEKLLESPKKTQYMKYPKIFYATRTHQQIDQVVKQLRLSGYKNVRMTVLSSRERSCVHPVVSRSHKSEKSELCTRMMASKDLEDMCAYYLNKEKLFHSHRTLESTGFPDIWDIEDLVKLGRRHTSCPYYGARMLMVSADIIFCPYNYLISPTIRRSMDIKLKGHVLIFDEGHNIEDVCRESASLKLNEKLLVSTINESTNLEYSFNLGYKMFKYLEVILMWLREKCRNMSAFNDYNKAEAVFSVTEFVAAAENGHFGKNEFLTFQEIYELNPGEMIDKMTANSKSCYEGLILVLNFIFNYEYKDDFNVVIEKTIEDVENSDLSQSLPFTSSHKGKKQWTGTLNFLCLNAATIFKQIKDEARSIIITSGTLSPLDSFDAELGVNFNHKAELSNEISSEQLFAAAISCGPSGKPLMLDYKNINSYEVQDDLGKLLLIISQTVPEGILVFFSSYAAKDNMFKRWRDTGVLTLISRYKTLFEEPKTSLEMKETMEAYYAANTKFELKGGIMFAIFRGKVSEGINFENEHARAVIAIGIPFPNLKAVDVRLKRAFNDRSSQLNGNEWYSIQGFRALNQALGRVIRHKDDWGVILLVDLRYKHERSKKRLSRWIRENIQEIGPSRLLIPSIKRYCNLKLQKCK